ncbi:S26 family signal peptidase [Longispora sp. K20-0274]|uniref:S26 family signal peptidase n=1 Tax=Longispora sp. K20-0274 TaxID=3088255 RepID=UPI00399B1FE0
MTWLAALLVLCCVAGAAWAVRARLLVVTVHGVSMLPTYEPGDRLLVRRVGLGRVRRGDVVVFSSAASPDPDDPTNGLLVKRAAAVPGDPVPAGIPVDGPVVPAGSLLVLGDNAARSHDSRTLGYIAADALIGVVLRPIRN